MTNTAHDQLLDAKLDDCIDYLKWKNKIKINEILKNWGGDVTANAYDVLDDRIEPCGLVSLAELMSDMEIEHSDLTKESEIAAFNKALNTYGVGSLPTNPTHTDWWDACRELAIHIAHEMVCEVVQPELKYYWL